MERFRRWWRRYPRQFWLLFGGMTLSMAGTSMVWPFLVLYASRRLSVPLTQIGFLVTLQGLMSLVGISMAGPLVDAWGRKVGMVMGLVGMATAYAGLSVAGTWWHFAVLLGLGGCFAPFFRVGGDAMATDLFPPERREEAFALLRMASNVGIAVGPAVGGFLAASSYQWAFYTAAFTLLLYALLLVLLARETRPQSPYGPASSQRDVKGYLQVLRDGRLLRFLGSALPAWMSVGMIWIFLSVHLAREHGLGEQYYGLLISTNAFLVATLQFQVTRYAQRFSPRNVMVVGALLYAISVGSVIWARVFVHFLLIIVVMTMGEMLLAPTASAWVANLAPPEQRGRYMSTLALMWGLGAGLVSPLGGWLNDRFSPQAPWVAGSALGLLSAYLLAYQHPPAGLGFPAAVPSSTGERAGTPNPEKGCSSGRQRLKHPVDAR